MKEEEYMGKLKRNFRKGVVTALAVGMFGATSLGFLSGCSEKKTEEPRQETSQRLEKKVQEYNLVKKVTEGTKETQEEKYILILEENRQLNKENKGFVKDMNDLRQQYVQLNQEKDKSLKELMQLNKKHTKTVEDYNSVLKQKEQLSGEQKKLKSQLEDLTKQQAQLTKENTKITKNYANSMEQNKQLEQKLEETNEKYEVLDKDAIQLLDEKKGLEKDRIGMMEKYNQTLEGYNQLLKQKEKFLSEKEVSQQKARASRLEEEIEVNKLSYQTQVIKLTSGLDIVFLKGDLSGVDKSQKDFYERTDKLSAGEIISRVRREEGRYALLVDADKDGIGDIMYKRGTVKIKKGKKDGTFGPAKESSGEFFSEVINAYLDRAFGLIN